MTDTEQQTSDSADRAASSTAREDGADNRPRLQDLADDYRNGPGQPESNPE